MRKKEPEPPRDVRERPRSISIIAGLLFLSFIFNVLEVILSPASSFLLFHFPTVLEYVFYWEGVPGVLLMCLTLGIPLVTIVSAIGLMLARNWARWLYVAWTGIYMTLHWFIEGTSASLWVKVAGFIPWAALIYYLSRPDVSEYFEARRMSSAQKQITELPPEPAADVWATVRRR